MCYIEAKGQRNPPGAWPKSSRVTDNGRALGLDTKTHKCTMCTRLLHDVTAKPVVMSTPAKDQVLIYTPESREAIMCKFLARNYGNYAVARHHCDLNLQPCKVLDVLISKCTL